MALSTTDLISRCKARLKDTGQGIYTKTQGYALTPLEGTGQYRNDYPSPEASPGSPVSYRMQASVVELYPYPDAADTFIFDYDVTPADLTDGGVAPVWPDRFVRAILPDLAMARAYSDDGNAEWAQSHREAAQSAILDMQHAYLSGTNTEHYPRLQDDWYD